MQHLLDIIQLEKEKLENTVSLCFFIGFEVELLVNANRLNDAYQANVVSLQDALPPTLIYAIRRSTVVKQHQ
jgi:hypothetical protein